MSRSYKKHPSITWKSLSFNWGVSRVKERECLHKEIKSDFEGDVAFPHYRPSYGSWVQRYYDSKRKIREKYHAEISYILDGCCEQRFGIPYNTRCWRDGFIEIFNRIKKDEETGRFRGYLEWLNTRRIKKAIKEWDGDPLDFLYYMNRRGFIEQAVKYKYKRIIRK